jgi:outer membrane autotransporter protein
MKRCRQLNRQARRQALFALERFPFALVNGGIRPAFPRNNLRGGAQGQLGALNAVLLAAPLVLAATRGANAQFLPPTVGPSPPIQTDTVISPPFTEIVGNTTINVPVGDAIDAPPDAAPGGSLNINTESALAPPGPISITSGGTGVASIFPSSPATISISSGPHGDVTIMSGGAAVGVSGGVSLTASNANGGTLTFQSTGAFGVVAQFGAKVDITGASDIANGGVGAVLIGGDLTDEGAIGNLTNVDISTTDAVGLDATRMGTIATMTNGSITVTGAGLAALYSDTDGVTNVTNVKITTTGDNTYGAFAEATIPATPLVSPGGGTINITGGWITTEGVGAFGVFAQGQTSVPSTITLNNSILTTTNVGAVGYRADGAATVSATNTTALTTGAAAPGGMLSNGATVMISGGSVKTTGAGSFGFLVQPFTPAVSLIAEPGLPALPFAADATLPNVLQISNNAMVTSAADAFHVQGAIADITVSGSSITSGNGVLLNTVSSGTTNLTATGSQLTGAITTDSSSTADVTLRGNTTWTMTGSSNLTNLVNDPSNIVFSPPVGDPTLLSSYKTLTVMNYTGMGGGITLNTFLGGDGSPSDQLIISGGSATGSTTLTIHNTTGPGEQTTANGILVVNTIGATTTPGAFALPAGELRAGAFDYDLFRGGLGGSDPQDWFLRSSLVSPGPGPGPGPEPPQPPIIPPTPPPDPLPPNVLFPIIGPELATYGVVQPLARQLGLSILGTLDDRVGDTYEPDGCAIATAVASAAAETPAVDLPTKKPAAVPTKKPGPAPCPLFSPSVWGRFFGQTVHHRYSAFADPRADGNLGGFQGGIDLLHGSLIAGHYERAGLYGAYGDVNADVNGLVTNPAATAYVLTHTGSMNLDAWSAGGYWTHVGPGGWYLDAVLQGTWYYGSASTQFAKLNTDGTGFIASLEGGAPFSWPQLGPGFVIEPQGQILWQKVSFRHDYDGLGDVALGDTTGPSGRIGLRTKWTIVTAGGQVWQPYLRGNLWRDWGAEANTVFSGTDSVPLVNQATMLEFGGGLTGRINANVSVFANVDYEFAVGAADDKRNGVRGAFGARYTW